MAFLIAKDYRKPDLEIEKLSEITLFLLSSPQNRLASKAEVSIEELRNETLFAPSSDYSYF